MRGYHDEQRAIRTPKSIISPGSLVDWPQQVTLETGLFQFLQCSSSFYHLLSLAGDTRAKRGQARNRRRCEGHGAQPLQSAARPAQRAARSATVRQSVLSWRVMQRVIIQSIAQLNEALPETNDRTLLDTTLPWWRRRDCTRLRLLRWHSFTPRCTSIGIM